jgi:hypothetical protein
MNHDAVTEVEDSADLLALEIISPEGEVRRRVTRVLSREYHLSPVDVAVRLLLEEFGLPSGVAEGYARYLYPPVRASSVREWLRQQEQ